MAGSELWKISGVVVLAQLLVACGPGQSGGGESGTDASSSSTSTETRAETSGDGDTGDGDGDTGDGDGDPGDGDGDPDPSCGDGQVDPGEDCDDGNVEAGDGCSPTCALSGGALLETFPPGPSWPEEMLLLTRPSSLESYLFLVGRTTLGPYHHEVKMIGLSTDGEELFSTVAPLPVAAHLPMNLETLDVMDSCWVSGWTFDETIQFDFPGWMWVARVSGSGDWEWVQQTDMGVMPLATIMRGNEDAAVLEYTLSLGGQSNALLLFDELGALELATPMPIGSDPLHGVRGLAPRPGGTYVAAGYARTQEEVAPDEFEIVAEDLWIADLDAQGEIVEQSVFAPPGGLWVSPKSIRRDAETGSYAVLLSEREGLDGDEHIGWAQLDASAESVLGWRSIGPGTPLVIEPDGSGGAYVLGDADGSLVLGHYGPDPDAPPLWEVSHPHAPRDLAVNALDGRAYVLTDVGVDVFGL